MGALGPRNPLVQKMEIWAPAWVGGILTGGLSTFHGNPASSQN